MRKIRDKILYRAVESRMQPLDASSRSGPDVSEVGD